MKKNRIGLVIVMVLVSLITVAQNNINSPYSRFGIGELSHQSNSTRLFCMGGLAYGIADPYTINHQNPASYGAFDSISFLFESGINGRFFSLQNTGSSESNSYITLSNFSFGFPIVKWWRASIGVLPFSKTGYNVKYSPNIEHYGGVVNQMKGEGGFNQIYIGNAFNIGKNLRLGVNANYVFGEERYSSLIYVPDSAFVLGTKTLSTTKAGDFLYNWGIQYDIHLKSNRRITLGATYSNQKDFSVKRGFISKTITGGYNGIVEKTKDTLAYIPDEQGNMIMPRKVGVGFSYVKEGRWLVGADFAWENWEKFKNFGQSDSLQNAWRAVVGAEITPKHSSISPLYTRMTYRMGFRFQQSYINLRNQSINELGISFGVKFPIKRSKTTIDLGFEIGQRGTLQQGLLKENFFNLRFGVNILEHWFYKRKYQ